MVWKGGIRRGQTQKAPPAAPSTVRLGGATERYRWEAGVGIGQRARRGSKDAAAKGTRRAIAPGWAQDPSLVGADSARRARGRSAGEGLRDGGRTSELEGKNSVRARTRTPPSSRRRCCSSIKASVRALRFAVRAKLTKLQLGRRRLGRRRPDLKQGHENWGEHRAEAREHGQGQGVGTFCPPLERGPRSRPRAAARPTSASNAQGVGCMAFGLGRAERS